jgi:hypothetical protein
VGGSLVGATVGVAVGEAVTLGVAAGVSVGDGAGLVGAGVVVVDVAGAVLVGAGVVEAGAVGAGVVAAGVVGAGTSLGRAVRPGTVPTPCGVVRPTARGWVTVVVEPAWEGTGVVVAAGEGSSVVGFGSTVGSTGMRGRARETSSEVRTGVCCGSPPPPAVIKATLKPEPERMAAVSMRKASLRPGSSRR